MKKLSSILFGLLFTIYAFSQDKSPWTESGVREIAKSGSEAAIVNNCSMLTQEGYLYYAEILVDRLLEFQPTSSNYNYRKGYLVTEIRRDYAAAIPYFEIAVKSVSPNYDMYSPKEKSAPIDAHYHLGRCYHFSEKLDPAKQSYQTFLSTSRKDSELIPDTEMRLKQLDVAKQLIASPINCQLKNLDGGINTAYPDYSSVVSFDGTSLYFTSRRPWENGETNKLTDPKLNQYPEDIYVSYLENGSWSSPARLDFCKPERNEATIALNTDEKRVYVYEDLTGNGDIYYSDFYNNRFNEIKLLDNKGINSPYWETHATASHDGSILVFSSERPGGYGGRDLYISKKVNGAWGEPTNLGAEINGPFDEEAPFISVDNKQLYFATNDQRSIGGFDIMISEMKSDGNWGTPKNVGYPFNSTNDDLFYTTTVDGLRGYLTSYRSNGKGEKDIYEVSNNFLGVKATSVIKGEVVTTDGSLLPDDLIFMAKITCNDCETQPVNHIVYTRQRDGKFMTGLQPCKSYTLTYIDVADNKVMGEETFKTECDDEYHEIYKRLTIDVKNRVVVFPKEEVLTPVEVVDYKNVELKYHFDYNKNKLTVKKGELKDFVKEIKTQLENGRQKVTITIESSASQVPTKTFNSNDELARLRGENTKYDLLDFFEKDKATAGKVTVVVTKTIVQGPAYEKDYKNSDKYRPYQYVFLKTE
jgi:tetratricopeptide (TPR) repeat protein